MTLAASDFAGFAAFLRARSAIVLEPGKEYLVETRLGPIAQREGLSVAGLIARLRDPTPALEAQVVEAMTTNETSFFRDLKPFEALRKAVIPMLVAERASTRTLRIWSAASSSGQEAYSLAMMLAENFPELDAWQLEIHATDLSRQMVERTRAGRYSRLEVNRGLPAMMLARHFDEDGVDFVVKPKLRARIHARQMNLALPWPSMPPMDLVLLRNVLIYFDASTKREILSRMRQVLAPGGSLLLGTAETPLGIDDGWRRDDPLGTQQAFFRPV